jgi:hypothetical protein
MAVTVLGQVTKDHVGLRFYIWKKEIKNIYHVVAGIKLGYAKQVAQSWQNSRRDANLADALVEFFTSLK